jgi:poly(3-hydroxybutyrate) depolymerase
VTEDLRELVARPGANSLAWHDAEFPGQTLFLHAARPTRYTPHAPLLFVHHGVGRNGAAYRDYWLPLAEANNLFAVAIEFPEASFPDYLRYHFGNMHNEDGTLNPREKWTYGIVPRLFDALRKVGVTHRERYGVFGHSAGGQFVHRMLSFGFRDQVAVAVSANAGTYAMPDLDIAWPFGLGETQVTPDSLTTLLTFPLTIMAGTNDTKTTGRYFPKGPRSMRQGETRWHRAHNYVRLGHETAEALGTRCAWTVIDVQDVGHDGHGMSIAAAPVIAAALHASEPFPTPVDRGKSR